MRPEWLRKYHIPLSSDAFSLFGQHDKVNHDQEVAKATEDLKKYIPVWVKKVERDMNILNSLNNVYNNNTDNGDKLKDIMHAEGINLFFCGVARKHAKTDILRSALLLEIVGRTLKNELRAQLRAEAREARTVQISPDRQIIVNFFNLIGCTGVPSPADEKDECKQQQYQESKLFWCRLIKQLILKRFPEALSPIELSPNFNLSTLLNMNKLFLKITQLTAIKLHPNVFANLKRNIPIELFDHDILATDVRVKEVNIVSATRAYELYLTALRQERYEDYDQHHHTIQSQTSQQQLSPKTKNSSQTISSPTLSHIDRSMTSSLLISAPSSVPIISTMGSTMTSSSYPTAPSLSHMDDNSTGTNFHHQVPPIEVNLRLSNNNSSFPSPPLSPSQNNYPIQFNYNNIKSHSNSYSLFITALLAFEKALSTAPSDRRLISHYANMLTIVGIRTPNFKKCISYLTQAHDEYKRAEDFVGILDLNAKIRSLCPFLSIKEQHKLLNLCNRCFETYFSITSRIKASDESGFLLRDSAAASSSNQLVPSPVLTPAKRKRSSLKFTDTKLSLFDVLNMTTSNDHIDTNTTPPSSPKLKRDGPSYQIDHPFTTLSSITDLSSSVELSFENNQNDAPPLVINERASSLNDEEIYLFNENLTFLPFDEDGVKDGGSPLKDSNEDRPDTTDSNQQHDQSMADTKTTKESFDHDDYDHEDDEDDDEVAKSMQITTRSKSQKLSHTNSKENVLDSINSLHSSSPTNIVTTTHHHQRDGNDHNHNHEHDSNHHHHIMITSPNKSVKTIDTNTTQNNVNQNNTNIVKFVSSSQLPHIEGPEEQHHHHEVSSSSNQQALVATTSVVLEDDDVWFKWASMLCQLYTVNECFNIERKKHKSGDAAKHQQKILTKAGERLIKAFKLNPKKQVYRSLILLYLEQNLTSNNSMIAMMNTNNLSDLLSNDVVKKASTTDVLPDNMNAGHTLIDDMISTPPTPHIPHPLSSSSPSPKTDEISSVADLISPLEKASSTPLHDTTKETQTQNSNPPTTPTPTPPTTSSTTSTPSDPSHHIIVSESQDESKQSDSSTNNTNNTNNTNSNTNTKTTDKLKLTTSRRRRAAHLSLNSTNLSHSAPALAFDATPIVLPTTNSSNRDENPPILSTYLKKSNSSSNNSSTSTSPETSRHSDNHNNNSLKPTLTLTSSSSPASSTTSTSTVTTPNTTTINTNNNFDSSAPPISTIALAFDFSAPSTSSPTITTTFDSENSSPTTSQFCLDDIDKDPSKQQQLVDAFLASNTCEDEETYYSIALMFMSTDEYKKISYIPTIYKPADLTSPRKNKHKSWSTKRNRKQSLTGRTKKSNH
eukprot:TRINITY_DN850_c0_g3_i5.p1 TRINITY_DN850_c0_g3~~TRINITY_DN850_c0_g3_i5.p1  ORF type:complete len:1493 (-),score=451.87 TRINITY_DN850_c0_g3_i5:231-4253(-)